MAPYNLDPHSPHALFARSECKQCPQESPSCDCPSGTKCMMTAQSCSACATIQCVETSSSSTSNSSSSGGGTNTGAIAGGVVGGLAAVGIIVFLIWWFVIRKKRNQQRAEESEKASSYAARAPPASSAAQSRKSTHSIASTVLTRASNVIQIAYIPGVTNRSPPDTPLVPPVPPLPGASADQHFFMPGDLRDSSWSDMTTDRRSMANTLRSSVATTIYRNDAIVSPMPAQQVTRTRAAVVSIHNGPSTPSSQHLSPDTPAVPAITPSQLARAGVTDANNNSSIVARTVTAKPVMVKTIGKKNNAAAKSPVQPIAEQPESSAGSSSTSQKPTKASSVSSNDGGEPPAAGNKRTSTIAETPISARRSQAPTVIEDSPAIIQSPFTDETPTETDRRNSAFLEGASLSSKRHSGAPPPRVESPFADTNEVK
ncbi:uncharacterized protein DSM5745_09227 [Aspergillus mulundensis]|uniref:Membrane anchor Opy2 N-terminal domain-containing protein n=1 Tax=Aspergillus mulundensis TaxID=1810919 RepID=A0A3D8R0C7_9EURO|nr:Uncharacterized protein DSM5745_09227 [Aspergillus mulundensis]RDW67361.1 Uncharacterized protein DSM5745_09227 [Aspergillus mulundensis]